MSEDFILVSGEKKGQIIKINLDEIVYIEALKNYIKIVSAERCYVVYLTLKDIIAYLPDKTFVQAHRSFIVNLYKISSFNKNQIELSDDNIIPIGNSYLKNLLQCLDKWLVKTSRTDKN